ncbi:MAG: Ni/Fe-hydrogenase cytochrome b subunit [Armatimonadetes bacterium]|nr:Ni/Fe-hydrogenase cytochrome b subunit [Armatimonadota bacterium]
MRQVPRIKVTFWRIVQAAMIIVGLYATVIRFGKGLGAVTNLSDSFPWGIWIGFDIVCGVALAAGGFTLAGVVYVFRLERYRPILRATILTAFLGYLMAIVSLLFDIGQPWRIWHPMVMWNEHSAMFEVALCVMMYTTVLALEFSPAVFEWLHLDRPLKVVHMFTPPLVIAGVLLSTLHQSTLGTLFVIAPGKVHGLWYTPFLPVVFYVSAIAVGPAMVIFESTISHRVFGVSLHGDILAGLGKAVAVIVGIFLVLRFATLAQQGNLGLIFAGTPESYLFLLEISLGFVLPMILFAIKRVRQNDQGRFYASLFLILGVVMHRLNVSVTGMSRYANYSYFPSFLEIATTLFIVVCGVTAFGLIVRYLPIFPAHSENHDAQSHDGYAPLDEMRPAGPSSARLQMATPTGFAVLGVLAALFLTFAYVIRPSMTPKPRPEEEQASAFLQAAVRKINVNGDSQLKLPVDYAFSQSALSPGKVVFSHERHVALGEEACTNCHPRIYPMISPGFSRKSFHTEKMYGCVRCHDGVRTFSTDRECAICHGHKPSGRPALPENFLITSGSNGIGSVWFSHGRHMLKLGSRCSDCHPRPFEMTRAGMTLIKISNVAKRMELGHHCAKCHDGKKAFSISKDCTLCHIRKDGSTMKVAASTQKP